MENMSQSVNENIPALVHALSSTINYSDLAPQRVDNFNIAVVTENSVSLTWEYGTDANVYFEIYRNVKHKSPCTEDNLVGITRSLHFNDIQLNSGKPYFYKIRPVNLKSKIKGPFAPELKLRTLLANNEFSKTLYPTAQEIGYVGQFTQEKNHDHFGLNSLFIGINRSRGICYGVIAFCLDRLPDDAEITQASFSLYPLNRVSAKLAAYGEWGISFLDGNSVANIRDYNEIANAKVIHIGQTIESDRVTQGVWSDWQLNGKERAILQKQLKTGNVLIRIDGPTTLPKGADSQIMQFDIGYGRFGSGIHYRPNLDITYTRQAKTIKLFPIAVNTITAQGNFAEKLQTGYDKAGHKIYGQLAFALHSIPFPDKTVITNAYLQLSNVNSLALNKDIRFTVELAEFEEINYESVKQRESVEYIGYEVSNQALRNKKQHSFDFDSYSRIELEKRHKNNQQAHFLIRATSAFEDGQDELVEWLSDVSNDQRPTLVVEYIERKKIPLEGPTNIQTEIENNQVKIIWENPKDQDFVGSVVVRNRFRPPGSPFDGVKLYGGPDEYTFDSFGNPNIPKYYCVFCYDNVPNYSQPSCVNFSVKETIQILEVDPEEVEGQIGEDMQSAPDE